MQVNDAMVKKAALAVRQARNGSITPPEKGTEYDEHLARAALTAAFAHMWRPGSMSAQWTYDPEAEAYYFAPMQAAPPPYLRQRHVEAIIDIASDGTLAGVELIDNMPPPPRPTTGRG